MIFDPLYFVFMIPGLLLTLWAQSRVRGNYAKFSKVRNAVNMTGAQVARRVLDANGLYDVPVEATKGELTDHYDPRNRTLFLSQGVYGTPSIAAMGIAAHEAGHAIQHARAFAPLQFRTAIVPAVNIGSSLGIFVLIAGIVLQIAQLAWIGVALFALATVFALITLPVESMAVCSAARKARAWRRCSMPPPGPTWPGSRPPCSRSSITSAWSAG
ncbi:MAG: putative Zn-dependent protease [Thermomicrobiales bacterium]|nr:putative Zn-dependent protease [Thermomicrobiales bacterium]